jgi:hypothetical protein
MADDQDQDQIKQEQDKCLPAGAWHSGDAGVAYSEPAVCWMGDCVVDPDSW